MLNNKSTQSIRMSAFKKNYNDIFYYVVLVKRS